MAEDEAIFKEAQRVPAPPTLRFYGWSKPSVSLGHFQNVDSEIDVSFCRKEGIDMVRRLTGGKAVYHDDDFTYAVIAGDKNGFFPSDIMGTYREISHCLAAGLRQLGIDAGLADKGREKNGPGCLKASCFSVPSEFEILVGGKKIWGSAQVRSRGAFLQHGSLLVSFDPVKTYEIMLPHGEPREGRIRHLRGAVTCMKDHLTCGEDLHALVAEALKRSFSEYFGITLREDGLTPAEEALKEKLLRAIHGPEPPESYFA